MPKSEPIGIRFWRRVNRTNGCWFWTGRKIWNGYGQIDITHDEPQLAHRVAWELWNKRSVPEGMNICHRCDLRDCVNPFHLFVATQSENMKDAFKKGRIRRDGIYNPRAKNHPSKVSQYATFP